MCRAWAVAPGALDDDNVNASTTLFPFGAYIQLSVLLLLLCAGWLRVLVVFILLPLLLSWICNSSDYVALGETRNASAQRATMTHAEHDTFTLSVHLDNELVERSERENEDRTLKRTCVRISHIPYA